MMTLLHAVRGARLAVGAPAGWRLVLSFLCLALVGGCARRNEPAPAGAHLEVNADGRPLYLSAYDLFEGNGASQTPVDGVIPYDLNSALFSDYMWKYRFVKLPDGTSAEYHADQEFKFPVGTIIAKTFACPVDIRDPAQGQRLLETRLLIREEQGWVGLPYLWNDEQTDAKLKVTGGTIDVSWVHYDGQTRTNDYIIPNAGQCKGCHKSRARDKGMHPIGPKARHLNRDFAYRHGSENQLAYWSRVGALRGAPAADAAPRIAVWDDPHSGTVDQRARAWLEINCAHCHNPTGPARMTGLDLTASQVGSYQFGVYRAPVATGPGSGGLDYDIVPGRPEESIIVHRISSTDPKAMMPELGKRMVHEEAVELIRQWVVQIPPPETNQSGR